MPDKNIFDERERGLETEYFRKKESELIEKIRARTAKEAELKNLAEATGVVDQDVLEALQDLGYSPDTVMLLYLAPLVQVAWAEGGVSDEERESILEIAKARGITKETTAYRKLSGWLDQAPPEEFYKNTLRAVHYLIESLPEDHRQSTRQDLVEYCTKIAEISGGILGFGKISDEERLLIARIATEIGNKK